MTSTYASAVTGALLLLTACAEASEPEAKEAPASTQVTAPRFYNVSQDPNSLSLMHLEDTNQADDGTFHIIVSQIMRGPENYLAMAVWSVDCPTNRMALLQATKVGQYGGRDEVNFTPEYSVVRAGDTGWVMVRITCDEQSELERPRIFNDDLWTIADRFWASAGRPVQSSLAEPRYFTSGSTDGDLLAAIRDRVEPEITFAGHFSVAFVPCGIGCGTYWFVDRRSGAVTQAPGEAGPGQMTWELQTTPDSEAITVIFGPQDGVASTGCSTRRYQLVGTGFRALGALERTRCPGE